MRRDKEIILDRVIEVKLTWGALIDKREEGEIQEWDMIEKSVLGIKL